MGPRIDRDREAKNALRQEEDRIYCFFRILGGKSSLLGTSKHIEDGRSRFARAFVQSGGLLFDFDITPRVLPRCISFSTAAESDQSTSAPCMLLHVQLTQIGRVSVSSVAFTTASLCSASFSAGVSRKSSFSPVTRFSSYALVHLDPRELCQAHNSTLLRVFPYSDPVSNYH